MNAKIGVVDEQEEDEDEEEEGKKDKGMHNREKEESIEKVDEIEDFNLNSFDGESENEGKGGTELKDVVKVESKDKNIIGKKDGNITENVTTSPGAIRGD